MKHLTVRTAARFEMIDITGRVEALVRESGITQGTCRVFVPHTTAAVTINENADPDVPRDILSALDRIVPRCPRMQADYRTTTSGCQAEASGKTSGTGNDARRRYRQTGKPVYGHNGPLSEKKTEKMSLDGRGRNR